MDKDRDAGHEEGPPFENDIEVMPDSGHQSVMRRRQKAPKHGAFSLPDRSIPILLLLSILFLSRLAFADTTTSEDKHGSPKKADPNGYDLAFIIDNRDIAGSPSAKEDVDAITDMLDRHMFAEHIVRMERPSFEVICDIFGGCPNETGQPWPSLISQIAYPGWSRLYVYYLGPGRLEGRQRQFLFENTRGQTRAYAVGWLHKQLEKTQPKSALVMMDTSFSERPLPCASEDPELIDETMKKLQQDYARLMQGRSLPRDLAELTGTMPLEAPHCDRYELLADGVERPLFTKFLLKGIVEGLADKEPFGDGDGMIELGELAAYTRERIKRAVQFQWGRRQTVWRVGPGSRAIARVQPRAPTWQAKKERKPPTIKPEPKPKPAEKKVEVTPEPERPKPERPEPAPDKEEDQLERLHPCDQDQESDACIAYCADDPSDFRCPFFGVALCEGEPISDACPCAVNDPRPGCSRAGSWCRWSSNTLGGVAEFAITFAGNRPGDACPWATGDEADIENGILSDLFGPIGWKLARPGIRPWIACMLNCQGRARPVLAPIENKVRSTFDIGLAADLSYRESIFGNQSVEPLDTSSQTAFEKEVCDDDLPPYIGLPRWMPGTLMISEALRFFSDCEPSDTPGRDKRPIRDFGGMPPPVPLVDAPPIQTEIRYRPPPPFAMPPPVVLPPIQPTVVELPPFRPSANQVRWLQSALILDNHNPGPIDGMIGRKTRAAIRSWRIENGVTPLEGDLTEAEFIQIIKELGEKFDQVTPGAPRY